MTAQLDEAIEALRDTRNFAKSTKIYSTLDLCRRIMSFEGGTQVIYERIKTLEEAGVFHNSDWQHPERLQSIMAANTIKTGEPNLIMLELLSQLRFAAVASDYYRHPRLSPELANHFLSQSLALNLSLVFGQLNEADRVSLGKNSDAVINNFAFVAEQIGYGNIIDKLISEIWRLLAQRPIQVTHIKEMVTQLSIYLNDSEKTISIGQNLGAERLISALYSPTRGCQEDPGLEPYRERLQSMDAQALRNEALGFSRAMHDTGLVSPYHAVFLRFLRQEHNELIGTSLGLSTTGNDSLLSYHLLVHRLIDEAVWPETTQVILGLYGLLERGILYDGSVALALWRQLYLPLNSLTIERLSHISGNTVEPRILLLSGVISLLGQPLGPGQGNNPMCQSVRALSMWSGHSPNYLMQLIACAARDNDVPMYFEGHPLSSAELISYSHHNGVLSDLDPVSTIIVPHLDAIYQHMGKLCDDRGEDVHKWVNPEFHGWWVGRDFSIAVDIFSGLLKDYEDFIRCFYACYHPLYNGNIPIVNPQPAGIASTDSMGRFLGWHAITILRVGFDPEEVMRVYFFNPNNDSGQNWGGGIQVSTEGHGERFGESSLCFAEFVSRLYLFHYDHREEGDPTAVDQQDIERITAMAADSWARERFSA